MSIVIYIGGRSDNAGNHGGRISELGAFGGVKLSAAQIKGHWLAAGGAADKAQIMTAIALAESAGWTGAINPGYGAGGRRTNEYSVGLWQINTLAHKNYSREQLKDPSINAREAVRILRLQGLRAWGAYTDGRYRPYMSAAAPPASTTVPAGNDPYGTFDPATNTFTPGDQNLASVTVSAGGWGDAPPGEKTALYAVLGLAALVLVI